MPKGNSGHDRGAPYISIFLQSAEAKVLPPSILPKASFKLSIINRVNPEGNIMKGANAHFHATAPQNHTTSPVHPMHPLAARYCSCMIRYRITILPHKGGLVCTGLSYCLYLVFSQQALRQLGGRWGYKRVL